MEDATDHIRRQNEAFGLEAFHAFTQGFPPAKTLDQSTRQLTTLEVMDTILSLYPTALLSLYDLSILLKESGYVYTPIKTTFNPVFKWLLE